MKDKYYMKDMVERFQVGRDTIKYYEKKGIIKSKRDENGYRFYDEMMVRRVDRFFFFHMLGFSFDQIKRYFDGLSIDEELKLNEECINMLENRIKELEQQIEGIKKYEKWSKELCEKSNQYTMNNTLRVCFSCKYQGKFDPRLSLHRNLKIVSLNNDNSIQKVERYEDVVTEPMVYINEQCVHCNKIDILEENCICIVLREEKLSKVFSILREIKKDLGDKYLFGEKIYILETYYIDGITKKEAIGMEVYIPMN